jgi:hypothetical protein
MINSRNSALIVAVMLASGVMAHAQNAQKQAKANPIDPEAMQALDKMGSFLRDQQSFTVRTTTQTDYVLDSGLKVRLPSHGELKVRRPDHLRADVMSDRKDRQFFFDGKTFTMYGPKLGYYATVDAPGHIDELADLLETKYGLQLPLVDLFRWGTDRSSADEITQAVDVGPTKIDGVDVEHYAFRQKGLDWQLWIQKGAQPLPRRVLLTTTDDPARPELQIDYAWDLNAKLDDSVFAFTPAKDSQKIALAEVTQTRGEAVRNARREARR